jgi:predicted DNA-binding transcriptional regulator AlpA
MDSTQQPVPCSIADTIERTINEKPALSVAEVATLTGFSRQTVSRMFEDEPGVLVINRPEKMNKRPYRSIRIPRHVYVRVVHKISN